MRKGPTIDDVAKLAGVSRGTVSRVLNGARYVSPAARTAVERAMKESGYVVNQSARTLVTRRANAVAFIVSEPQERLFEDPNFSVLLRSCTQELGERDANLVLMLAGTASARSRVLRFVRAGHVDGVLLVSTHSGDPLIAQLQESRVPAVSCGRSLGTGVGVPYVGADDRGGARSMVDYLRRAGRRRIATIAGPLDTPGGVDRLDGYRDVVGEDSPRRLVVAAADWSHAAGEEAMTRLLEASPDLDAVFVASDLLAAGAMAVLRRAGRTVPDDVAVGGFDDSPVAVATDPQLTTVRQPLDLIGTHMVRVLQGVFEGQTPVNVIVPTELVVRGTA
ncbi:MAG: LacI family transcriptional regulator [Actinomycetales bacterium]|nr:LacI family transcriptional regulator [Actinomycetales bacterium]